MPDAPVTPTVGAWYRLTQEYGIGVGMLQPLRADPMGGPDAVPLTARVAGIHPPGTPGIGAAQEDSALVEWVERSPATQRLTVRRLPFRVSVFGEYWVADDGAPPEWAAYIAQETV